MPCHAVSSGNASHNRGRVGPVSLTNASQNGRWVESASTRNASHGPWVESVGSRNSSNTGGWVESVVQKFIAERSLGPVGKFRKCIANGRW